MIDLPRCAPFCGRVMIPRLVDSTVEAPGGFGFPSASATLDGGAWWQMTIAEMIGYKPHHLNMIWAFSAAVRGGDRVRVSISLRGVTPGGIAIPVSFSDSATFDDGSMFAGGIADAVLDEAVGLRDDEAVIWMRSGQPLIGGEFWSLERGPEKGPELHINSQVEYLGSDRWKVRSAPTMRQDHPAGAEVNFNRPAFAATVPDKSTLWPEVRSGSDFFLVEATFVEAP